MRTPIQWLALVGGIWLSALPPVACRGQKPTETFSFSPGVGLPVVLSPREKPVGLAGLTARYHPTDRYAIGLCYQFAQTTYAVEAAPQSFDAVIQRYGLLVTNDYVLSSGKVRPLIGWGLAVLTTQLNYHRREGGLDSTGTLTYGSYALMAPKLGVRIRAWANVSLELAGAAVLQFPPGKKNNPADFSVRTLNRELFTPSNTFFTAQASLIWRFSVRY
jgi:hypothetical protein